VGGLAHYLEAEGLPTALISLIREHTERMKPPRALAVPFPLGRPFGAPNEPEFQARVLRTVLDLLDRNDGPILDDFPDAPPGPAELSEDDTEGWTCPINLKSPVNDLSDAEKFAQAIKQEIALLRPWYDESVAKQNGRRLDGLTDYTSEEIVDHLIAYAEDQSIESFVKEEPMARAIKFVADDLKHFYYQAAMARPGSASYSDVDNWFFGETLAGMLIIEIRKIIIALDDAALKRVGMINLLPHAMSHHAKI
jgi:hypothetical protein